MFGFIRRLFRGKTAPKKDTPVFTTQLTVAEFKDCILRQANEENVLPFAKEVIKSIKAKNRIDVVYVDPDGYDKGDEYFNCVWGTFEELFGRDSDFYRGLKDSYRSYYDSHKQLVIEWHMNILFGV